MKPMVLYLFILILSLSACEDPVVPVMDPDCNPNPCAEDACEPELCNSDTTTVDEEPSDSVLYNMNVLWKSDLPSYGYLHNYIVTDQFILTNLSEADGYQISCLSKETGELLWTFSDPIVDRFSDLHFHQPTQTVIAQRWGTVVALDGATGDILSKNQVGSFSRTGTLGKLLGDYYYVPVKSADKTEGGAIRSHVSNLQTWNWVYKMHIDSMDGIEPDTDSFNHWFDPETGDEILVLQHRMAFPTRRIDLLAYNLTADSILWWHKDIDPAGNSNIQQIDIFEGKAVFFGSSSLHCVDISTGNILWNKIHPAPPETPSKSFMFSTAELFDNNKLWIAYGDYYSSSINDYSNNIMILDFQSGQLLFEIEDAQSSILYATKNSVFTNSDILIIDGSSGQAILTEEVHPNLNVAQISIDENTKTLFSIITVNGKQEAYIYALEIPEGWL